LTNRYLGKELFFRPENAKGFLSLLASAPGKAGCAQSKILPVWLSYFLDKKRLLENESQIQIRPPFLNKTDYLSLKLGFPANFATAKNVGNFECERRLNLARFLNGILRQDLNNLIIKQFRKITRQTKKTASVSQRSGFFFFLSTREPH